MKGLLLWRNISLLPICGLCDLLPTVLEIDNGRMKLAID